MIIDVLNRDTMITKRRLRASGPADPCRGMMVGLAEHHDRSVLNLGFDSRYRSVCARASEWRGPHTHINTVTLPRHRVGRVHKSFLCQGALTRLVDRTWQLSARPALRYCTSVYSLSHPQTLQWNSGLSSPPGVRRGYANFRLESLVSSFALSPQPTIHLYSCWSTGNRGAATAIKVAWQATSRVEFRLESSRILEFERQISSTVFAHFASAK